MFWDDEPTKRTLGIRDKQILYRNANKKCQNPGCGKEIEFDEMQVGHKTAWSKGGRTTLKNSVCLCYRCNKLQGTDSWSTFMKKQGIKDDKEKSKDILKNLSINQLKFLSKKHHIKVKGQVEESFFDTYTTAPSKSKYIKALSGIIPEDMLDQELKEMSEIKKRVKKRSSDDSWF